MRLIIKMGMAIVFFMIGYFNLVVLFAVCSSEAWFFFPVVLLLSVWLWKTIYRNLLVSTSNDKNSIEYRNRIYRDNQRENKYYNDWGYEDFKNKK